ncbi:MAG: hypothetical protein WC683_06180 [bacterium]
MLGRHEQQRSRGSEHERSKPRHERLARTDTGAAKQAPDFDEFRKSARLHGAQDLRAMGRAEQLGHRTDQLVGICERHPSGEIADAGHLSGDASNEPINDRIG